MKEVLNQLDLGSDTWMKLEKHMKSRLEALREKNDLPRDEMKTAMLRGRILEVKELLGLATGLPVQESDDLGY